MFLGTVAVLCLPLLTFDVGQGQATVQDLSFLREGLSRPQEITNGEFEASFAGEFIVEISLQSAATLPSGEYYFPQAQAFFRLNSSSDSSHWAELPMGAFSLITFSSNTGLGTGELRIPTGLELSEPGIFALRAPILPPGDLTIEFVIGGRLMGLDTAGEPHGEELAGNFDLSVSQPDVSIWILEPDTAWGVDSLCTIRLREPFNVARTFELSFENPGVAEFQIDPNNPFVTVPAQEQEVSFFVHSTREGDYQILAAEGSSVVASSLVAHIYPAIDAVETISGLSQLMGWNGNGGGRPSLASSESFGVFAMYSGMDPAEPTILDDCTPASVPPARVFQNFCSGCVQINDIGSVDGPLAGNVGIYYPYSCDSWGSCNLESDVSLPSPRYNYDSSEMFQCGDNGLSFGGSVSLTVGAGTWTYDTEATVDWKAVNICHKYSLDSDAEDITITVDSCN